jgi:hypothetical protein
MPTLVSRRRKVHEMLRFDQDFVAGIYPLKVIDWSNPAIKRAAIAREPFQAAPLLYVGTICTGNEREREGRFATAIYCGGGFMLLKRQVIERMIMAYTKACTPIPMPRAPKVMPYSTA